MHSPPGARLLLRMSPNATPPSTPARVARVRADPLRHSRTRTLAILEAKETEEEKGIPWTEDRQSGGGGAVGGRRRRSRLPAAGGGGGGVLGYFQPRSSSEHDDVDHHDGVS